MSSELRTWLEDDHRAIEGFLHAATSGAEFNVEAFSTARERLMRHIAIEEKIVFRALRSIEGIAARDPDLLEALRTARIDHAAITTLLVPTPDSALVGELVTLLTPHNVLEEAAGGLYERCDDLLGDVSDKLLAEAKAYPAVAVRDYDAGATATRTAAEARVKAERLRSTMSW